MSQGPLSKQEIEQMKEVYKRVYAQTPAGKAGSGKKSNKGNRRKKQNSQQARTTSLALAGALLVLTLLVAFVPGFGDKFFSLMGIESRIVAAGKVDSATKIHIIDVGQGDATLYEQNGHFALIDAGPPDAAKDIQAYLDALGIEKLEYLVMTHPHADHIGGMQQVVENCKINKIILPDFEKAPYPTDPLFQKLMESIADSGADAVIAQEGDVYPLGAGTLTVLQNGVNTDKNYNLLSLMVLFEAEGLRVINTGDAEKANEAALLQSDYDLRADVFIAGHHGSSTSNTEAFLRKMWPSLVVVSCGQDNSYGHPHREALAAFDAVQAEVLRTDLRGTVVVGVGLEGELIYEGSKEE